MDRDEWWMTPQTVNAVNLPLQNALNFPAAILQPPYFDPDADAAHNYGSMGAIIGHEISHSFDDQGSKFDAEGRLANWWTKADLDHFKAAGEALAAQFDAYRPFPDLARERPSDTQRKHRRRSRSAGRVRRLPALVAAESRMCVKDGFSGDQRFFISFGQSWRAKIRDAELRRRIATDGHAPDAVPRRHAYGTWMPGTTRSPSVRGQKLYLAPTDRVHVW